MTRKTFERNGLQTIDEVEILQLNEKHIEEGLDHKNVRQITIKYHLDHRKHSHELLEETIQQNFYRQKISNQSSDGLQNKIKLFYSGCSIGLQNNKIKSYTIYC